MNKKHVNFILVLAIVILLGGYFLQRKLLESTYAPKNPPITVIKYNGNAVQTSLGDHSWIPKNGGSSYQTSGEYTVGINTPKFDAKPDDIVHISIPYEPIRAQTIQIVDNSGSSNKEYKIIKEENEYILTLPEEKGEYIFKIVANWSKDPGSIATEYNTATIFRVEIK
ncbi:MAG: hypothetical protein ACM3X7_11695 [Solirubrobacterales bacterium]